MNLPEKYRPRAWSEVLGQDKVVSSLLALRDRRGMGGDAYWLAGKSGTGKTTIANLIAEEVASEYCIESYHASAFTAELCRHIGQVMHVYGWGEKSGRAWVFDEAHCLNNKQVSDFLALLEPVPKHVVFCFTTTLEGESLFEDLHDAQPFGSRCKEYTLASRGLGSIFAARAQEIAQVEGLDGKPITAYKELVNQKRANLRKVLQVIEQGAML